VDVSISDLRIVTWNIHKGFAAGGRRFTLPRAAAALAGLAPDLVLLQEVQGEHRRKARRHAEWPIDGQATTIASAIDAEHAYAANATHAHGHHGNAIISRLPLTSWCNHDVSNHRFERRGLLQAEIDWHGRPLHLICCHLDLTGWGRTRQVARLQALIRTLPANDPLLITGDFNDWRCRIDPTPWGLHEAHSQLHGQPARTFPAWQPFLRLDRIYVRGLRVTAASVLREAPWTGISDHTPLICTVTRPE
jgi:endonuclease/exonuclease/phosphatase family metal-dependent hydrolase